jgi:hypothetical protein
MPSSYPNLFVARHTSTRVFARRAMRISLREGEARYIGWGKCREFSHEMQAVYGKLLTSGAVGSTAGALTSQPISDIGICQNEEYFNA